MKMFKRTLKLRFIDKYLGNIKITYKMTGLLVGLLVGFVAIGLTYNQVLVADQEALKISEKMIEFENGLHEVQLDLLNARRSESEFYLKKYPILLGKFDTRIIVASQNLNNLTSLVKGEEELGVITKLGEAFEIYRERFIQAAEAQIDIGLDENTGLLSEIKEAYIVLKKLVAETGLSDLEKSVLIIKQLENSYLQKEDVNNFNAMNKELGFLKKAILKTRLTTSTKNQLTNTLNRYQINFGKIADTFSVMNRYKDEVKTSSKLIEPLFGNLIDASKNIIQTTRDSASRKRDQITAVFITTLIFTSVVFSLALFFISRSIVNPMRSLQSTVVRVNEGDISARAKLDRKDELGELANAFDKLLDEKVASLAEAEKESERLNESVIGLIRSVSTLAKDKNLAVKIPVSEDITGAIGDSLNLLAKETAKILLEVKATSNQVADVSSIVKSQSDHVIDVANAERKEVETTADLLRESVVAMNEIAKDAQSANEQADKTMTNTQQALDIVLTSVEGINSIRSTISETEKRIKRLGERSQEITGIVNLINSIAERTHILALNASMHAASAGEAGRGFAVVADEVQRLAENAREATSEIATVVNNIRVETADTVTTMNTAISQVAEGTRLAEQAGNSMKDTQQATSELVRSVQHIAESSVNQAKISNQLLERAQQIQDSTELTGRELLEQTKSTDTLVRYSESLVSTVGVFKLPGEDVGQTVDLEATGVDLQATGVFKKAV